MKNEKMFRDESVWRVIVKTSIPTMITMLIMIIYNMADIFFIGKTGDTMQVAALSLSMPVFSAMSALGTLIGSGGCSAIAIAIGKKEEGKVRSMSAFCCYMSIILGVVFAAVVLCATEPVLDILGITAGTRPFARIYLRVIAAGAPFTLFASAFANIVRAEGAVKESMLGNIGGSIINIILDPLFIFVFNMGVAGAAAATVIGNICSAVYFVIYVKKKKTNLTMSRKYFAMRKDIALPVLSLGLPTAVGVILSSMSSVMSNKILVTYGEAAVAAMGVAGKLSMIVSMMQMAVCTGIQPVLAYNFGAGLMKRFMEIIKKTAATTIVIGVTLTVLSFLVRSTFVSVFINDSDVISYGVRMIVGTMVTGPFIGIYYLTTNFLQATSKASYATVLSLLRQCIIFIPMLYFLSGMFGLDGIIFAHPLSDLLSIVVGILLCIVQYRNIKVNRTDCNSELKYSDGVQ